MERTKLSGSLHFSVSISDYHEQEDIYCCIMHHPLQSACFTPTSYPVDYAHIAYNGLLKTPYLYEDDNMIYTLYIEVNQADPKCRECVAIDASWDEIAKYNLPIFDAMESWDFIFSKSPIDPDLYLGEYKHQYDNIYARKSDLLESKRRQRLFF